MRPKCHPIGVIGAIALLATIASTLHAQSTAPTDFKFQFGSGKVETGYTQVSPTDLYSKERGWGFEPGPTIQAINRGGDDALRGGFVTSDKPFYFSVELPEGNYNVHLTLGDGQGESTTTVKAELRRLMLEKLHTDAGQFLTPTIIVNLRTPKISTGGEVKLKPRETTSEKWDWDEKMTLEFNDKRPCLCAMEIAPADVPTVYILGDSTVCDQPTEPWNSWGQMLPRFFKPGIAIANHAESGESLRSSLGAHRLDKVASLMKPGDYLLIQYGHNDMKKKGEGIGAFTSYTADLEKFVDTAISKGATPVLITSMNRKSFDSTGHITNTFGDYPEAVRRVAREKNVALIDLNAMSKTLYEAVGPANIDMVFEHNGTSKDGTHHSPYGSYELAKCVIEGLKQNHLDLVRFLVDDLPTFDPGHPDSLDSFDVPPSPSMGPTTRPLGN
jgi:lysophospholipase L1-like esterase